MSKRPAAFLLAPIGMLLTLWLAVRPERRPRLRAFPKDLVAQQQSLRSPRQSFLVAQDALVIPKDSLLAPQDSLVPLYYINLDRSPDRQEYLEAQIDRRLGNQTTVTRVKAIDFEDPEDVASLLGFPETDIPGFITNLRTFCRPHKVMALTLSHFKAMGKAAQDGVPYALIMEDDASFDLVPFWPKPIQELVAHLNRKDPQWELLRLAWTPYDYKIMQSWKKTYPNLPSAIKWRYNSVDLNVTEKLLRNVIYSGVATLYSRSALNRFASTYVNIDGRPSPVGQESDPTSRFTFNFKKEHIPKPVACVIDVFLHTIPLRQYIATPPYFTYRIAEGALGTRTKAAKSDISDHAFGHLASRAHALQFMFEHQELQFVSPAALPPLKLLPSASNSLRPPKNVKN